MEMRKLMEQLDSIMEGTLPGTWYHGSSGAITSFSDEFVGNGNDEYGPGIYFTNKPHTAIGYGQDGGDNGMVYECQLTIRKELSKKQRPNKAVLLKLMQNTPDDEAYTNWDPNPNKGYQIALQGYMDDGNMYDALMGVWYDWYRYNGPEFVRALVALGLDAFSTSFSTGEVFMIVYNIASIKVVNAYTVQEALDKFSKE